MIDLHGSGMQMRDLDGSRICMMNLSGSGIQMKDLDGSRIRMEPHWDPYGSRIQMRIYDPEGPIRVEITYN